MDRLSAILTNTLLGYLVWKSQMNSNTDMEMQSTKNRKAHYWERNPSLEGLLYRTSRVL